ncbi:MAG: FkbM family methyltransferase [Flavisolibacter sp.]|nr:FkbM family methyltransferase [Flavisolibacter sp.]
MNLPVWLYWEGDKPDWINACHKTIFNHADDVRLLTPESFDTLRDWDREIDLSHLCIAHRADFIRAFLLARFGGIWIDSDCIVMKSLQPLMDLLNDYDFMAFRQRQGNLSNSFVGAPPGSKTASTYYRIICDILRSGQPIEWLTIGSQALTTAIAGTGARWYEIDVSLVQPFCWSNQEAFFAVRQNSEHGQFFNEQAYCYMLSKNTADGFIKNNPDRNFLEDGTFFTFLLNKSADQKLLSCLKTMEFRKNTDDDMWIIPEVIEQDMYKVKNVLAQFEHEEKSYVIDCGAHIGTFSVICSVYLKNVDIISFEPNPDSFLYLYRNSSKFGNIRAFNKAVDVKEGTLQLFPPDDDSWTGRWTSLPNPNPSITVETVNLFSFIRNLDKPVFILKMDLEGYEEYILNEVDADSFASIKILIIETHRDNLDHSRLLASGFHLLFQPHISTHRQFVYLRS